MDEQRIPFSDFAEVDLRVGLVEEASEVKGSEKLIRLVVNFGNETRTVFTGLKAWYDTADFASKKFIFVYNLEPKKMPGGQVSQGMLLAVNGVDKPLPVLAPEGASPGERLS